MADCCEISSVARKTPKITPRQETLFPTSIFRATESIQLAFSCVKSVEDRFNTRKIHVFMREEDVAVFHFWLKFFPEIGVPAEMEEEFGALVDSAYKSRSKRTKAFDFFQLARRDWPHENETASFFVQGFQAGDDEQFR